MTKLPILLNECSLVESLQKAPERVQYLEIKGNEFHYKTVLAIAKIFKECIEIYLRTECILCNCKITATKAQNILVIWRA